MPLVVDSLKSALESQWLVPEGGSFPQSAMESGDRFAGAFCSWFAGAMAATFSCVTAMARRSQLATQAGAALGAQDSSLAGNQLAMAVASYIAGQSFPPGTALFPMALPAAAAQMISSFADPGVDVGSKAQDIAAACHLLVVSTLVAIPTPPGPPTAPIT